MIKGDGQSVDLITGESKHVSSYPIKVTLTAEDGAGNPIPTPEPLTVNVVPARQWNHRPKIDDEIHTREKNEKIQAGSPFTLMAHARDDDDDKLTYYWKVDSPDVTIEHNGEPEVTLYI